MTEERFTVDDLNIQDNSPKGSLYLLEEQGGVNALCNLINGLNTKTNRLEKENEQLKKENMKLNCIMKQLEVKYEDKGFSLAYDMGECE